jgi:uncharacterized protein
MPMQRSFEFRDPIHGFIELNPLERDVVNHPAFQRLRRIKQLAWTDMVYPGATHSRFEHSLGVMHLASRLFRALCSRHRDLLAELGYDTTDRQHQLVRLAALLHDVGHAPFSHAAEELLPSRPDGKPYSHEEYSSAIVEFVLKETIERNEYNRNNFGIRVEDLKDVFSEVPKPGTLLLREIISGQMDADRMDYMLRDSHHAGVSYGNYDLNRIVATVCFVKRPETDEYSIGISHDGVHAAEGLLIARYMLFTQVYFHKTRVIYDYHLVEAIKELLRSEGGAFPPPSSAADIERYLAWDDWRVYGGLSTLDSPNSRALKQRSHFRRVFETTELRRPDEVDALEAHVVSLTGAGIPVVRRDAEKSWYKLGKPGDEIFVKDSPGINAAAAPLSVVSPVVKGLQPVYISRLYVPAERRRQADSIIHG